MEYLLLNKANTYIFNFWYVFGMSESKYPLIRKTGGSMYVLS